MHLIDGEKAFKLMDGDETLFRDLFAILENSLAERYSNVERALASGVAADLEHYAHQLKGALRAVAAEEVCELLQRLEKCGARADFDEARALYPQVRPLVDKVLELYHSETWVAAFRR